MNQATKTLDVRALEPRSAAAEQRVVVSEVPLALTFNRIPYVVMMVTPNDLEDFVRGFVLTEGLLGPDQAMELEIAEADGGWIANLEVGEPVMVAVMERRRTLVGQPSCGICGLEELEAAIRELPSAAPPRPIAKAALFSALEGLAEHQPLNRQTGAAHAAALVDHNGSIRLVREDAGRHTALDKLVGAALRSPEDLGRGFVLLTSRCSYELVQKALVAGVRMLVTISAPTSLAVELAGKYGLTVIALARPDRMLVFSDPHGIFD